MTALDGLGVDYAVKNGGAHVLIQTRAGRIDYWPGTGLFRLPSQSTDKGLERLLRHIHAQ